jgi:hypothetical protein
MPRLTHFLPLALATLSATALLAQADPAGQTSTPPTSAPIERHAPTPEQYEAQHGLRRGDNDNYDAKIAVGGIIATSGGTANAQPVAGVYLRVAPDSTVRELASDAQHTEFRVDRGLVNISVHGPADGMLLLVDLPNGQVQMLKNGFYTFNAATNTVRVLKGEASAFASASPEDAKAVKVKEAHAVSFVATTGKPRSVEFAPFQARNDVIPRPYQENEARTTDGPRYGYGPYSGFYGGYAPYGAWGSPYWGDPYFGYGYPFGFGLGFGYGYSFGGGFYRGGFGGFRGRR